LSFRSSSTPRHSTPAERELSNPPDSYDDPFDYGAEDSALQIG